MLAQLIIRIFSSFFFIIKCENAKNVLQCIMLMLRECLFELTRSIFYYNPEMPYTMHRLQRLREPHFRYVHSSHPMKVNIQKCTVAAKIRYVLRIVMSLYRSSNPWLRRDVDGCSIKYIIAASMFRFLCISVNVVWLYLPGKGMYGSL